MDVSNQLMNSARCVAGGGVPCVQGFGIGVRGDAYKDGATDY